MSDDEVAILILSLEEDDGDYASWADHWRKHWESFRDQDHYGDCTKVPMTCSRCVYEETMKRVPQYREAFNIPTA